MKIAGPIFAILTPFDSNCHIDYGALRVYLDFLKDKGVKNIITNGTTAEFASLTFEERIALAEFCRSNFEGTLINNISSCSIGECKKMMDHSGDYCHYFLMLPPFYYANASDAGIVEFFKELLAYSAKPVLLYNFPRHTQVKIKPEVLRQLKRESARLVGIKDSGGDIEVSRSFKDTDDTLQVYIGSDSLAFEALRLGFDGSVSGGGNALPEFPLGIYNNFVHGELALAKKTQGAFNVYNSFRKKLQLAEIATTKVALSTRITNFPVNVRPPLTKGTPTEISEIGNFMNEMVLPLVESLRKGA